MKRRTPSMDAYAKGLIAAEAEGHAQGRAGFTEAACRYSRPDFRMSWKSGWLRGKEKAKPERCNLCDDPRCDGNHPG
jgi:hypothetical protein